MISSKGITQAKDANFHFKKGEVSFNTHLLVDAAVHFTEAVSIDSTHVQAYYLRGECFRRMNQENESIRDYEQALKYDSTMMMPMIRLIHLYKKTDQFRKGIKITTLLIKYHPKNIAGALRDRGFFYEQTGDISSAIKDYQHFLKLEDESLESLKKEIRQRISSLKK